MSNLAPIVFIHGTRTSSLIWEAQEKAMRALGHRTIAIDLPGHGENVGGAFDLPKTYSLIKEQIVKLNEPVILVGMSLGGYIGLGYAAQHPEDVIGVLAAACSTETSRSSVRAYRVITSHASDWWASTKKALIPQSGVIVPIATPGWSVVSDMLGALGRMSSLANLRKITSPVWLVSGQYCPLRIGERNTFRASPLANRFIIPGVGHDVNLHAPEAFNRILMNMVTSLQPKFINQMVV